MNVSPPPVPPPSSDDILFRRIFVIFTEASMAAIYGWLAGFARQPNGDLSFQWRWPILLWAFIGFASTAWFWRKIWPPQNRPNATRKDIAIGFIILLLPGLWWLILPLRSLSSEHFREVMEGLTAAAIVLTIGAFMLVRLGRAFEADGVNDDKNPEK